MRRTPQPLWTSGAAGGVDMPPDPLRWSPFADPRRAARFIDGLRTIVANGDVRGADRHGRASVYTANRSMDRRALVNADGEMLFVPQQGRLHDHHRARRAASGRPARWRWCRAAWRSSIDAARRAVARLRVRELRRRRSACPSWGRSAPTAWPTRATFRRRWPRIEPDTGADRGDQASSAARCGATRRAPRRSTWWPGTATWRRCKYDTAHFMTIGSISFDHPGSVDLHRAHLADATRRAPPTATS